MKSPFERAWNRVVVVSLAPNVCWNWVGANSNGSGQIRGGSRALKTSRLLHVARLVFATLVSPIIVSKRGRGTNNTLFVRKVCGQKDCCRPSHLRYGPILKPPAKPRKPPPILYGEQVCSSKLKDADVLMIRKLRVEGYSAERIFKLQDSLLDGVPPLAETTIRNAVNGSTFKHLPIPEYPILSLGAHTQAKDNKRNSRLDHRKVRAIKILMSVIKKRRMHNYKIIGARFGVSPTQVRRICDGDCWHSISIS